MMERTIPIETMWNYNHSMQSILEVAHLTKKFGSFTAVDDISFTVDEGEIVGLLGPNGAGKTTTIFMLIDLIEPTRGDIRIFGLNYRNHREDILQQLNYSSTYMEMTSQLTVIENLRVIASFFQVKDREQVIHTLTDKFGVSHLLKRLHRNLSAGERTRVYLVKAFLNSPRLLLLDEPTASLDPDIADLVRQEIMAARARGTTILLTSHNMAEVEEICDRVIFINHGKILAEDTPEELARKVRKIKVNLMIKDGQKRTLAFVKKAGFTATSSDRYVTVDMDEADIAYFLAGLAEIGVEYREISIDKPSLEDYFIKMSLTGNT
ncbi:hypothetical protein A2154_02125 [Candidatus Gottesmanbacteria bacterium RBG_16_43_7]|uniref:ABC transporter domain-containing protein n=1 Tax=Candidatus Gottesmanbacteria bacterium RBG_16_43_7 TaxID=1798373 RepID=A0A1F5Z9R1_9BACT|nr:MAG: hypothetical protein A2154_02125 [Candidatus Gottesmanbacteria bacterium RBG_16_43_7]